MLFACGPCQSPIVCNDVVKNKETNAFLPNLKGQHRTWVATYYRGARESRDTGTVHWSREWITGRVELRWWAAADILNGVSQTCHTNWRCRVRLMEGLYPTVGLKGITTYWNKKTCNSHKINIASSLSRTIIFYNATSTTSYPWSLKSYSSPTQCVTHQQGSIQDFFWILRLTEQSLRWNVCQVKKK